MFVFRELLSLLTETQRVLFTFVFKYSLFVSGEISSSILYSFVTKMHVNSVALCKVLF